MPITKAEFKELGIDASMVPVGIGSAAFLALQNKQIDALNLFDSQHATLETQGTAIRRLPQLPRYEALFSNGMVAHEDMIRDKPEVLAGFGRAMAKATVFCETNREACVRLFWKEYPNTKPAGDDAKVLADSVKVFSARFNKMLVFPEGKPRQWVSTIRIPGATSPPPCTKAGSSKRLDVDLDSVYTNAFVDKFSDFDTAAVQAQAKAFKDQGAGSVNQAQHNGSAPVFRVQGLEVTYRSSRGPTTALEGFSTTVAEGEFLSILGPSGCGKSTLLKVAAGPLKPSAGVAELRGQAIDGPRRDVGIVFQHATLLPWQNVLDNVLLPIRTMGMDIAAGTARAHALLKTMGWKFEQHYPHELSGGMQQRVGIARGLIHDPSLLLMDEPFAALDAMTRETMMVELQRIWSETRKSVMFITHSIPEAVFLSSKVVVLGPRPARVLREIDIDLPFPRPRKRLPARSSPSCAPSCARCSPTWRTRGRHERAHQIHRLPPAAAGRAAGAVVHRQPLPRRAVLRAAAGRRRAGGAVPRLCAGRFLGRFRLHAGVYGDRLRGRLHGGLHHRRAVRRIPLAGTPAVSLRAGPAVHA